MKTTYQIEELIQKNCDNAWQKKKKYIKKLGM